MYLINPNYMTPFSYFACKSPPIKKKYDALRAFFFEQSKAADVAVKYGYTLSSFYSLTKEFRLSLKSRKKENEDFFFKSIKAGRAPLSEYDEVPQLIIDLRKKNFSIEDIVSIANSKGFKISYGYVYQLLNKEGFARVERRSKIEKKALQLPPKIKAEVATKWKVTNEKFQSSSTGIFSFLPYIKKYELDKLIKSSDYPETKQINKLSSILSFIALKASGIKRYSDDDLWCMDRGLGLFAGLNVLPKSGWLSSYSSRVTREMNTAFLRVMHTIWKKHDLLSDTCNLDFTTIPYWGEGEHLENNWSGKRNKALSSMLAVLAQDPDSGIIDYGDTNVLHKNESTVVLEYLDFYRQTPEETNNKLRYLVFDSKFTNYENLAKLDDDGIKFVTIRRRGKNVVEKINSIDKNQWTTIRVESSGLKKRTIKVFDEKIKLRGYSDKDGTPKEMRQIIITGHGKLKPALIITNDHQIKMDKVVRKYCRRWLIEKCISEQIDFFHLNRVSSSMVIKVDFDLTMTILVHNLYRLFAKEMERYSALSDENIYGKFINNNGAIKVNNNSVIVELKKKRDLPELLEMIKGFKDYKYNWIGNKRLEFLHSATS